MEPALKQRLVGAAVLVALAVIFLPMLVQGPAPDSGAADVPLDMPDAPAGEFQTRELPLVTPARAPEGGAVGMDGTPPPATGPVADDVAEAAIIEEAPPVPAHEPGNASPADAAELATQPPEPTTQPAPSRGQEANGGMFPAATAGGNYAVSFGSYSSVASADAVVKMLRESQLPGFRESAVVDGKTWQRVRIGPYATRAEAEAARLRAAHVRDDVGARVVVLDAADEAPAAKPAPSTPKAPAAADTGFAVQLAAFSKASDATALRDRARAAGFSAFTEAVATDTGTLTRVRVGPVMTRAQAEQLRDQVRAKLGTDGVVRPHP
ncbi:SPOR domain-containing protein [Cognatiluteimonas lumbrici]|uniref:SPOR domain-containing protein n=1 Tax=Cognatiluteimonas lumbrici TaxID=2559601 RepID=UPI001129AADA|nr:SPOR domain-containing protein [Luteimonas lumbrici]